MEMTSCLLGLLWKTSRKLWKRQLHRPERIVRVKVDLVDSTRGMDHAKRDYLIRSKYADFHLWLLRSSSQSAL